MDRDMNIAISADAADQIVYDSLVYYKELLTDETKGLTKRKKKLAPHQLEDLGRNVELLAAMEIVMDYFKPVN